MKKITLLLMLLIYSVSHSQTTHIPDANFEQALIDLGYDSGSIDGNVPTANIQNITSLDIRNKQISDLTGIKDFTRLSRLDCSNNEINHLELPFNSRLSTLYCNNNNLTSLNVSANTSLYYLNCSYNNLKSLNLDNNNVLIKLLCMFNDLERLSLKNGNNSRVTLFNATHNNLNCIQVDDAAYSFNHWRSIDNQASFSENCKYKTYVPDNDFEQALIDLGYDSGPLNDYVYTANIENITYLSVDDKNIHSLTGIEDFESLRTLRCVDNFLSSLDLSYNTMLSTLYCTNNNLSDLNLSNNSRLTILLCAHNDLSALDLSNNTNLISLLCGYNELISLNLSNHYRFLQLDCIFNDLESLNVKNGNNSNMTSFVALHNDLDCIEVDDDIYSTTNWTSIDNQTIFSTDCSATSNRTLEEMTVKLYPNPTKDILTIDTGMKKDISSISIYNMLGEKMKYTKIDKNTINISNLPSGLYTISILIHSERVTKMIQKTN